MFGAYENLPFTPGEWQASFTYRGLRSDDHYRGTQFQYQREALGTYVLNTQEIYDLAASYTVSERFNVSASLPIVNATWSIPMPINPPGPRIEQNAAGIGDFSFMGRYWLLDPAKHPRGNVSAGIGIKAPTGEYDRTDSYPDILTGANEAEKAVDQSIQPGDGGWGVIFDFQGYKRLSKIAYYASLTYLANPRDTNGTPSIVVGLGVSGNPSNAGVLENSVPDQYLVRAGAAFPIKKSGFAMSLGFRMEGLPRYDLFGSSHGWRRPGYETFVEPGFSYTMGASTWTLHVPRALLRNRQPNPYTVAAGDATFPDYIVLFGYSHRFQRRSAPAIEAPEIPTLPSQALPAQVSPDPSPQDPPADGSRQPGLRPLFCASSQDLSGAK